MADEKEMNEQEVQAFRDKLAELAAHGTEAEAREYVSDHLPHLPEEVQSEIIFSSLYSAVQSEREGLAAVSQVQEDGLAAAEKLEAAKEALQKEGLT